MLTLQVRQFELVRAITRQPADLAGAQELMNLLPQVVEKSGQLKQARQKLEATAATVKATLPKR